MGKGKGGTPSNVKVVTVNKKARFGYHIGESFEAGIVLTGAEIKSIRQGSVSLSESYILADKDELFLVNAHIKAYAFDASKEYNPTRRRKLLMHKHEIDKLRGRVEQKGFTIVPLKLYLKRGYAKLEIALAKGKHAPDKRDAIKDRELKRDAERAMKERR